MDMRISVVSLTTEPSIGCPPKNRFNAVPDVTLQVTGKVLFGMFNVEVTVLELSSSNTPWISYVWLPRRTWQ